MIVSDLFIQFRVANISYANVTDVTQWCSLKTLLTQCFVILGTVYCVISIKKGMICQLFLSISYYPLLFG